MTEPAESRRILIVDEDALLAEVLELTLNRAGYRSTVAHDGRSAQALLNKERFDAVLLELAIPLLDGSRLLRWLRQELGSTLPVLVHSAVVSPDKTRELVACGATEVLGKPVGIARLREALARLWQA